MKTKQKKKRNKPWKNVRKIKLKILMEMNTYNHQVVVENSLPFWVLHALKNHKPCKKFSPNIPIVK